MKRPSLMSLLELAGLPEVTPELESTEVLIPDADDDDGNCVFRFQAHGDHWEPVRAGERWFRRRLRG
jgi:hypothetical protein